MYFGDFSPGSTVNFKFTSRNNYGIPASLMGASVVVYKGSSVVNANSGVTLTTNFNSVVGLNNISIDTSVNSVFYSTGSDYQVLLTTGFVGTTPVGGELVESFSIRNRFIPDTTNFLTLSDGVETGYTLQQALRLILSSTCAKLTGAEGTSVYIRDINDTKNRIVATVTESGNRTNIVTDVS